MIRIDRSYVRAPQILRSVLMKAERHRIRNFFRQPLAKRAQQRYDFNADILWSTGGEVRISLVALFQNKCAYCESALPLEPATFDHLRPPANARDPYRNSVDPDHYWWLYYEWSNIYLACRECSFNKRDQFPISGTRAVPGAKGNALAKELPLLLDPCADDPAEFLEFQEDGRVVATEFGPERGQTTIDILGLNREALVTARAKVAAETRALLNSTIPFERAALSLRPSDSHLAVRRAIMRSAFSGSKVPKSLISKLGIREHRSRTPRPPHRAGGKAVEAPGFQAAPAGIQITYVTKIEIQNFRAIRDLTMEFHPQGRFTHPTPSFATKLSTNYADRVGWKVLLGENGSGKSSIVHAICLALAGKAHAKRWLKGRELLRRPHDGEPQPRHGSVTLHLSRGEEIAFTIDGGRLRFTSGAEGAGTFLRAYGATRLLPNPRTRKVPVPDVVQIENLFNPFTPLHHADRWLAGLPEHRFNVAARTLKDLLRMDPSRDLVRDRSGRVLVPDEAGVPIPLPQLSDGYQTVIALAVDIMAGLPKVEEDYRWSPGIVLLDELGTHLHPRWRMVIVESLRNAFSSMQFIATTHEPLCLRGLRDGEIAVMARDGDSVGVLTDLPSPERLRIDQLLTSPFFGLHTTIDPEIDRQFQEYYDLLATPDLDPTLEERRDWLRGELSRFGVLGYTRRDQLMYEVVDRYLARAQKKGKTLTTLPLSAKKELVKIWRRVGALRETAR